MPDDWAASVVVPIFKGKGDPRSCMAYRKVDEVQFGFMPSKGTILIVDAVFILRGGY